MSIERAKKLFAEKYYEWCLEEWGCELKHGYPLLRLSKEEHALAAIQIFESYSKEDKWETAVALVRRNIQGKFKCIDGLYTGKDEELVQKYWDLCRDLRWKQNSCIIPHYYDKEDCPDKPKFKRRDLRKAIIECVKPYLGDQYEDHGGGEWRYTTPCGPWLINTSFDVGGNFHQLCYDHCILLTIRERVIEGISLTDWLGISGQMSWNNLEVSDIDPISIFLAKVVEHFLQAAPKLLENLVPD
jgi:hypothetical protein